MDCWARLRRFLEDLGASDPPEGGRVGAVLVLLAACDDGDLELVYTRRRDDLTHHPGQISFPGGRVDPGETPVAAALREAAEEVALDPATVTVLGRLPAFFIPPSGFWLQAVIARWDRPHPLRRAEAEVSEVLRVRLSRLRNLASWRAAQLSVGAWSWAWQLDDRHVLWGATGMITAVLLDALVPDWHRGMAPEDLSPDREVRPWLAPPGASGSASSRLVSSQVTLARRPRPALLPHAPEVALDRVVPAHAWDAPVSAERLQLAGTGIADAVARLGDGQPVLVLAGGGGNGAAGLAAAAELARRGHPVQVVLAVPSDRLDGAARAEMAALPTRPTVFDGILPSAAVAIDALVGGGLRGRLQGVPLEVLLALRQRDPLVVGVDVPSGLHPTRGLVGDILRADLTVALGAPREGLFRAGLQPFVGDLYLVTDADAPGLVRLAPPSAPGMR